MACGAKKQKEHDEFQAEVDALREQQQRARQHIRHVREVLDHEKKKQQTARDHAVAEAMSQMQQHESMVEEHSVYLKTLRGHTDTAGQACSVYFAEARGLAGAGLEPTAPRLLVEVWEALGSKNCLLCEQWIPERMLLGAATAARELALVPRLLFSRPAQGKPVFGSAEHLGTVFMEFKLNFNIAPLQSPVDPFQPGTASKMQGAPQAAAEVRELLLRDLTLTAILQDKKSKEKAEQPAGKVFLCLWLWGESMSQDHRVPSDSAKKTGRAGAPLEADLATVVEPQRSPPPSLPAPASPDGGPELTPSSPHRGYWRLRAISIDGISEEEFAQRLGFRSFEAYSVDFKLQPGAKPTVFGRQHQTVHALLSVRPDLLKCISRKHVELQAAPDGQSLIVKNISPNPIDINGKTIVSDALAVMHSGGRLSFLKLAGDGDSTESSPRDAIDGMQPVAGRDRLKTRMHQLHASPRSQGPILTFELLSVPRGEASHTEDDGETEDSDEGDEEEEIEKDEVHADFLVATVSSAHSAAASVLVCENISTGTCSGYGGDALYKVVKADARTGIYCAACCLSRVAHTDLFIMMSPQSARPAHWELTFRSRAVEAAAQQPGASGECNVSFTGQEIRLCAPPSHPPVSTGELHRRRAMHFAAQRKKAQETVDSHVHRETVAAAESREVEQEVKEDIRKKSELSELAHREHATTLADVVNILADLKRDASILTTELKEVEAANEAEAKRQLEAAAALQEQLEAEQSELAASDAAAQEAARRERAARMKQLKVLRGAAKHLEPPKSGRCSNGGSMLENHKRLLRVTWEDGGLLYRDARIEIYAVIHRPANLRETAVSQPTSASAHSSSPSRPAPSAYHYDPAFAHSLWAEVKLCLVARKLSKFQGLARHASTEGTDAADTGFAAVSCECGDYDSLELDYEALPCDLHATAPVVEQTFRFELLEFITCNPMLLVKAQLSVGEGSSASETGTVVKEHHCQVPLPVFISTFLRPLSVSNSFLELWDQPGLATESATLPSPLETSAAKGRHRSPVAAAFRSPFLTPATAMASSTVMKAVLSCGGAFQGFQLPGGALGLAADLPAHGCIEEGVHVLVSISSEKSNADADGDLETAGDHMPWTVEARSPEHRLAAAVLAVLASQLKCLPQDAFVVSADSPLLDHPIASPREHQVDFASLPELHVARIG